MIRENLRAGDAATALSIYESTASETGPWSLEESDLREFILGLGSTASLDEHGAFVEEYVRRFPGASPSIELRFAELLVEGRRPSSAIAILASIDRNRLAPREAVALDVLAAAATKQLADGTLELGD